MPVGRLSGGAVAVTAVLGSAGLEVRRAAEADSTEVVSLAFTRPELLTPLLGDLRELRPGRIGVLRAALGRSEADALESLGFRREAEYIGYLARL